MENRIREVIIKILKEDNKARNNDNWLIIRFLREIGVPIYIDYRQLRRIPSFSSILRVRRKIQNEEMILVPNDYIKEKRENLIRRHSVDTMPNSQFIW